MTPPAKDVLAGVPVLPGEIDSPVNNGLAPVGGAPVPIITPAQIEQLTYRRFNPFSRLTAHSLANALDAFEAGDLRPAAVLWAAVIRRDTTIATIKAKREEAVALRDWTVVADDESPAAQDQKAALEMFYKRLVATDALNAHATGGFSLLATQMMDAVPYGYTADGFTIGLDLATPCDINALERFFAKIFGRLQGFWLPSPAWQMDIVASVSASEFLVKNSGLADTWTSLPALATAGQYALYLYLRPDATDTGETAQVIAVTAVDDQTERITLSAPLTSGVPDASWVAQRLIYVRLVNDTLTLTFQYEGRAKTTFDVLEMPVEYASVELGDRPAFGYHFWRIVGGVRKDWYYTSFERELSIGTVQVQTVCAPAPISHAEITRTTAGDREQLEINSWRFDGSPLEAWQPFAPQYDLFVEVWEVDLGGGQPEIATTVFAGLVDQVVPKGRAVKVTCTTRLDRLNTKLPRFWVQGSCNYLLYGACCKVSRAANSVDATVVSTDAAGLTFVLQAAGLVGKAVNWAQFGDAETADAEGLPQYRTVTGSSAEADGQITIMLNAPFDRAVLAGNMVTIAAGCDLQFTSPNGCPKFNNKINFGGHPHIAENLSLKAIPLNTDGAGKGGGK